MSRQLVTYDDIISVSSASSSSPNVHLLEDDYLQIDFDDVIFPPLSPEDIALFVEPGCDILTGLPIRPTPTTSQVPSSVAGRSDEGNSSYTGPLESTSLEPGRRIEVLENIMLRPPTTLTTGQGRQITPHTHPILQEPVTINGSQISNIQRLRPTTTVQEVEMRRNNSIQKFITREGVELFLPQNVLNKINFREIQSRKNRTKTINLPNRYQAQLRVRADGQLMFYHYHKRGLAKIKKRLNINVQRGGVCSKNL